MDGLFRVGVKPGSTGFSVNPKSRREERMRLIMCVASIVLAIAMPVIANAQKGKGEQTPAVRTNFGNCTEQQIITCQAKVTAARSARADGPMLRYEQYQILSSCLRETYGCTHR